ncbi:TKL protein kinase [Plasmodium inui San Antonio 1]|uniref:TKL protein kinase n=1 Tax=Plasmodium inui San Antonio 1 TaxID=1237626 RepID=W7A673_9APIC|nr:TKL protein kinase [Plasmodium inui San Antonio 1]EUD64569.1 TKL protein kinase [Plasmodium inui San Antonio 1]
MESTLTQIKEDVIIASDPSSMKRKQKTCKNLPPSGISRRGISSRVSKVGENSEWILDKDKQKNGGIPPTENDTPPSSSVHCEKKVSFHKGTSFKEHRWYSYGSVSTNTSFHQCSVEENNWRQNSNEGYLSMGSAMEVEGERIDLLYSQSNILKEDSKMFLLEHEIFFGNDKLVDVKGENRFDETTKLDGRQGERSGLVSANEVLKKGRCTSGDVSTNSKSTHEEKIIAHTRKSPLGTSPKCQVVNPVKWNVSDRAKDPEMKRESTQAISEESPVSGKKRTSNSIEKEVADPKIRNASSWDERKREEYVSISNYRLDDYTSGDKKDSINYTFCYENSVQSSLSKIAHSSSFVDYVTSQHNSLTTEYGQQCPGKRPYKSEGTRRSLPCDNPSYLSSEVQDSLYNCVVKNMEREIMTLDGFQQGGVAAEGGKLVENVEGVDHMEPAEGVTVVEGVDHVEPAEGFTVVEDAKVDDVQPDEGIVPPVEPPPAKCIASEEDAVKIFFKGDRRFFNFDLPANEIIERKSFEIIEMISEGSFGTVYKALWQNKIVAVKKSHINMSLEGMRSIVREVNTYRSVSHENIVEYYGVCIDEAFIGIVLEYFPRGTVFDMLYNSTLIVPYEVRLQMAVQLVEVVNYLHSVKRFVHRDLKTSNFLFDEQYNLKICDFGKTRKLNADGKIILEDNGGSPRYMAPECFMEENSINEKSDIWGLACCLIEIFANQIPFQHIKHKEDVVVEILVNKQKPNVPNCLHPKLHKLLERSFCIDPEERPSCEEYLELLLEFYSKN